MAPHSSTLAWKSPWVEEPWWAAVHGVAEGRTQLSNFTFTFHFHALEKEMATHSSVLTWRIPGMGEPGGLPSLGLHSVRHDWSDLAAAVQTKFPQPLKPQCTHSQHDWLNKMSDRPYIVYCMTCNSHSKAVHSHFCHWIHRKCLELR